MIERLRERLRGEAGYSLVEMLTVMVIMSVVFAGITDIFVAGSKAQADQDNRFQAQLATRLAMDKIRKDIHCASDVTPFATNSITLKLPAGCGGDLVDGAEDVEDGHRGLGGLGPRVVGVGDRIPEHEPTSFRYPTITTEFIAMIK